MRAEREATGLRSGRRAEIQMARVVLVFVVVAGLLLTLSGPDSVVFAQSEADVSQAQIERLVEDLKQTGYQAVVRASDALVAIGEPCVPVLRRTLETATDKWLRIKIIAVLTRIPGEQSVSALVHSLKDVDPQVQENATKAITTLVSADPGIAASALVPALVDSSKVTRRAVRDILYSIGWTGTDIAKELTQLVSPDDTARSVLALDQIRELGTDARSALPRLLELLRTGDLDPQSRVSLLSVVVSVGGADTEEVAAELQKVLVEGDAAALQQSIDLLLQAGWSTEQIAAPFLGMLRQLGDGAAGRADGAATTANGVAGRADGAATTANGVAGRADGAATTADGAATTANGVAGRADGAATTADGAATTANGAAGRADGAATTANGAAGRADGAATAADGAASRAIEGLVQLSRRFPAAMRFLVSELNDETNATHVRAAVYRALEGLVSYIEDLDRGPIAVKVENGVYVGWRLLATDPSDIAFDVYRDGTKINGHPLTSSTNFLDPDGQVNSTYVIHALSNGQEWSTSKEFTVLETPYLSIPLQKPKGGFSKDGMSYSYSANDASVGDLDGDGEYEIVLKWDPSNSHDNAHDGYTGEVILDAYKLDGTHLWRIDLGRNIRAGAHYTQFMVYDLDGDGRAEVACKTADGTVDGVGNIIGDPDADYRNSQGRVLDGPEYLTVFDGQTGAALVTVDYEPPRGRVTDWGDNYGNRSDRFLACVAYLDGQRPSLVMCRGYYTRTVLVAYNFRDGQLTKLWTFDSNTPGYSTYAGQGNHNLSVADVDFDGKDEIIYGACAIDHDGTGLYTTGLGHGDAMHVGDLDPERPGLEVFQVHEQRPNPAGIEFRDARTGELIWGIPTDYDVGRGVCADIDPNYPGEEMWASGSPLYSCRGEVISQSVPSSTNFAIWWDGDLLRELLDSNRIDKWDYNRKSMINLLTARGCTSNNGTKSTPCLQADILGDWREEVIWATVDSTELRIFTTTDLTEYRMPTLMHDRVYRLGIAWQNVAYNQPPHTSFFLGHGMTMPELVLHDVMVALAKHAALKSVSE
jgi:hypothetical protein